jgi:hypothetical protein
MRSRLEARVAGIFDGFDGRTLRGPSWEYEPCAFADGDQQYLPDFRVWPTSVCHRIYVEVRPTWERAKEADSQMRVILASEPEAILWSIFPIELEDSQPRWGLFLFRRDGGDHQAFARDDAELVAWLYLHPCRFCAEAP